MDLSDINLNSFLKLGFFLDYKNPSYSIDFSGISKSKYRDLSEEDLIDIGIKNLKKVIEKNFEPDKSYLVPISGGIDSRALLATLLDFTSAKNIYTYTFGTPGTLDYEIGNFIAKKLGTIHTKYPLTKYIFNLEELIDISKRIDHQTMLFHHPPIWDIDKNFGGITIIAGFMGGPVSGSHTPKNPAIKLDAAKRSFLDFNIFVKSIDLTKTNDMEYYNLIEYPSENENIVTMEEQLDCRNRQLKYIAPHVLIKGSKYQTPFIEKEWFDFMFSIDSKYRRNQYLYKKILLKAYPKLFSIKTKTNYGLNINVDDIRVLLQRALNKFKKVSSRFAPFLHDPYINYIDFNEAIRNREDLNRIIYNNIMDLKKRNLINWVNIDNIWKLHINKVANHAEALIVLASLEIHLKAQKNN